MESKPPSLFRLIQSDYIAFLSFLAPLVFWVFYFALLALNKPISSFDYIALATTVVGAAVLGWRYRTIASVFVDGLAVKGTVCNIWFFRDRGRIEYIYSVNGEKYQSGNAVHKTKRAESFKLGTEVVLLVDRNNPKRAFLRDLYTD